MEIKSECNSEKGYPCKAFDIYFKIKEIESKLHSEKNRVVKKVLIEPRYEFCNCKDVVMCFEKRMSFYNPDLSVVKRDCDRISNSTYLQVKCNKCGHIWTANSKQLRLGNRKCKCRMSSGERIVAYLLDKFNIPYIYNYYLGYKRLRADFYIKEYNTIIEYDGIQHFQKRNNYFGDLEGYNKVKINDDLKNKYCAINKIKLIRIPYDIPINEMTEKIKHIKENNIIKSS